MQTEDEIRQRVVNLRVILGAESYTLRDMPRETDADNDRYLEKRTDIQIIEARIEELLTVLGEKVPR